MAAAPYTRVLDPGRGGALAWSSRCRGFRGQTLGRRPSRAGAGQSVAHERPGRPHRAVLHRQRVRTAGMVRRVAASPLVTRFEGGDWSLANRVRSIIARHVWCEDYGGEER